MTKVVPRPHWNMAIAFGISPLISACTRQVKTSIPIDVNRSTIVLLLSDRPHDSLIKKKQTSATVADMDIVLIWFPRD